MSAIGSCVVILPVEALEAAHAFYRRGMAEISRPIRLWSSWSIERSRLEHGHLRGNDTSAAASGRSLRALHAGAPHSGDPGNGMFPGGGADPRGPGSLPGPV